jgi:hypothetical protein
MRRHSKILSKVRSCLLAGFVVMASLFACTPAGNKGSGDVLVRVYDEYLYVSDLDDLVPPGTSIRDSLTMVRTFVQNWVDKTLLVKKAEENLPEDVKDLSKQLEEYRNSLIIFEYEKMLVKQEMDTVITSADIEEYYQANKSNFVLKEDILSMRYLILHVDSPAIRKFRTYMRSEELADQDSLALYSSKYAESFNRMLDQWIDLEEMTEIVPINEYSFGEFVANRRFLEVRDSAFVYMVYVNDYKPLDSIPPVVFVEKEIRNIILNRRKNELIKNMRQGVLLDATEHNQVEIY